MEHAGTGGGTSALPRLEIVNAATYVERMTGTANEGKSWACQGLHNARVLAYVSTRTVQSDRRLPPFV